MSVRRNDVRCRTLLVILLLGACSAGADDLPTATPGSDPRLVDGSIGEMEPTPPRCRDVVGHRGAGVAVNPGARPLGATANGDERLRQQLHEYAERFPETFGGFWIDRVDGSFALAFTDQLDAHVAAVAAIAQNRQLVKVVQVEVSEAALLERQAELTPLLGPHSGVYGTGASPLDGVVSIDVEVYDPAVVDRIVAAVGSRLICVDGPDPRDVVPDGPQPLEGEGWRLLVSAAGRGEPYRTGFADSREGLADLWARLGLAGEPPAVDFEAEAVIYFGPAVSGSCRDIRLDGVEFGAAGVWPTIVLPGGGRACTADANPHAYLVAVERARLPRRPFTIDLFEDACRTVPGVCEEQRTEVGD